MSNWINEKYEGDMKNGWYHGNGRLELEDGTVY